MPLAELYWLQLLIFIRTVKQPYIFTQIVREDSDAAPRWQQRIDVAQVPLTQRKTWPERPGHGKPRYYSFDQAPTLTRTPWETDRYKRHSQWARHDRTAQLPAHIFEELPHEIYSCIVGHLEATYTNGLTVDVSGRKAALLTLCLTSRRWAKVGIEHLYRDLWLPSSTSSPKRARRFSMARPKSRLELLVRTLSEAPSLSFLIRRIHVTGALARELESNDTSNAQHKAAHRMLQEVVEICTEVELVTGYNPPATREYAEYYKLLFSRGRISGHAWQLNLYHSPVFSSGQFADLHERWQWLETLILCKTDSSDGTIGPGIISAVTNRLWSLKHLMISGFGKEDFHNGTLLSLRPLQSLRLENLDGVTDQGIFQLSQSRNAFALESLSLVDLELVSMRTIQILLANLTRLRRFRFVQNTSPTLLVGGGLHNRRDTLASPSIHHLHWDTLIPGQAIESLALSIKFGLFPSLRTLKAPSDPNGALQALCRPIHRQALTACDLKFFETVDQDRYTRSLRLSRLQAQLRIREIRSRPSLSVVVSDEEEQTHQTHVIGSYLGDVRSKIEYLLEPDVLGEQEALASLQGVVRKGDTCSVDSGVERLCGFDVLF
jgi:hypothetical protein